MEPSEKGSVQAKMRFIAPAFPPSSPSLQPPASPAPHQRVLTRKAGKEAVRSITEEEIEEFWRHRRMKWEEHLLAAEKAAARIRARALTEEDYARFEESLKDLISDKESSTSIKEQIRNNSDREMVVGIKDWWTKSKYAYLNQPAIQTVDGASKRSFTPNSCFYHATSVQPISTLGVF